MSQEALSHSWFHQSERRKSSMGGSNSRRLSSSAPSIQTLGQTGIGNSMLQRLRSFAKMTSFQQEVMRVAVKKLDGAHLAGIKVSVNAVGAALGPAWGCILHVRGVRVNGLGLRLLELACQS